MLPQRRALPFCERCCSLNRRAREGQSNHAWPLRTRRGLNAHKPVRSGANPPISASLEVAAKFPPNRSLLTIPSRFGGFEAWQLSIGFPRGDTRMPGQRRFVETGSTDQPRGAQLVTFHHFDWTLVVESRKAPRKFLKQN